MIDTNYLKITEQLRREMYYLLKCVCCAIFKDDFEQLINGLWFEKFKLDEKDISRKSIIYHGSTLFLDQVNWESLSNQSQMEWLNRFSFKTLLGTLLNNEQLLDYFCKKNLISKEKTIMVFQKIYDWNSFCVGPHNTFEYKRLNNYWFKNNIVEPVWDYYNILSRNNERECQRIKEALIKVENIIKQW